MPLRRQRRDLHWESARVVKQEASNWSSMLTVNKGTAQGVLTDLGFHLRDAELELLVLRLEGVKLGDVVPPPGT